MMTRAFVKNDPYFMGNVLIKLDANEEYNRTYCSLTVRQIEEDTHVYQWEVTMQGAITDPIQALNELKTDKYYDQGACWQL